MFWHDFLYAPLLNLLIWLADAVAGGSLGVAVIALTVLIRVALLPLSILSERNALAFDRLQAEIRAIEAESKTDQVLKKERIRELLHAHKVSPWAKVMALAFQGVVLVLLYQVFIGGINAQLGELYPFVTRPEVVNTSFFGFELGSRDVGWAAAVGIVLFLEIVVSLKRRARVDRSDLAYLIFFPAFVFGVLWLLPMVKSLFILTSLAFSIFLHAVRLTVFRPRPAGAEDDE